MAILAFNAFFPGRKDGYFASEEINEWLDRVTAKDGDYAIEITVKSLDGKRQKKMIAKAELEALAVDAAIEHKAIWKQGEYHFEFLAKRYLWKGEVVHITANEALFLFRWLVKKDVNLYKMHFLRNMRRRLGADFLREIAK